MDIRLSSNDLALQPSTRKLLQRMLSPLCGMDKGISFGLRGASDPAFLSAGAELTGVHNLLNEPPPKDGAYHIGGSGIVREEALIRVLAETTERYAQVVSELSAAHPVTMASYEALAARGERIVDGSKLNFFSDEQFARPGFPFQRFQSDSPLGWIKAPMLTEDGAMWVPGQLLILGYRQKPDAAEKWLLSAVTTGTAAHTTPQMALRNAILELIQIDAAMGHWYSAAQAQRIILDDRVCAVSNLIARHFDAQDVQPEFYWLPCPGMDVKTIACLFRGQPGQIPSTALGLGCDMGLPQAMYKALLEAVGVVNMAKIVLLHETLDDQGNGRLKLDPQHIYDLDLNVAYYALPENRPLIERKFSHGLTIPAAELPPDGPQDTKAALSDLVERSADLKLDWVYLDLTTEDVRSLGFSVIRAWSPDLISLALPSAPPLCHPRFQAYGGASHDMPHPYP